MEYTKEELISNLYTLRAGLSSVSQIADELRQNDSSKSSSANELKIMNDQIQYAERLLEQKKTECRDLETNFKKRLKERTKETRRQKEPWGVFIGLAYTFWLLPISLPIITLIYFILRLKISVSEKSCLKNYIAHLKKEIIEDESQLRILKQKRDDFFAKCSSDSSHIEASTKALCVKSTIYSEALAKQYGQVINQADWDSIDLIIFYLESGRGDTLKECLHLVDRQRQTDQIVNAIDMASTKVCSAIRSGVQLLGQSMVSCFNVLSNQIDSLGKQMYLQHSEMMQSLKDIKTSNTALLSATQLGNALQAKANATSQQLVSDYEYVQMRLGLNHS